MPAEPLSRAEADALVSVISRRSLSAKRNRALATVPALSCDDQRWKEYTPTRRTVWAIGLGHNGRELRCEVGAFERYHGRCPVSPRRRPCGQIHPEITTGKRALIDDVAAMVPAGELVPLRDFDGTVHGHRTRPHPLRRNDRRYRQLARSRRATAGAAATPSPRP
jgi:hypothetical protein